MTTVRTTLVSPEELAAWIAEGRPVAILDASFDLVDTEAGERRFATGHLPGGDMPGADPEAYLAALGRRHPWLPAPLARHYVRLYGTRLDRIVGDARSVGDLGRHFGGLLHEREARYLRDEEWAVTAEDVLERRTKHGLRLTSAERQDFAEWTARDERPPAASVERARVLA